MLYCRLVGLTFAVLLSWAPPAHAQEMRAEVIHWWTSGGESAAVQVFAEQFKTAGGTWVDTAIAGGANARTAAINRTVGGNPPTAMQFNTGKQFDDLVENGLLTSVDDQAAARPLSPAPNSSRIPSSGHGCSPARRIRGRCVSPPPGSPAG